MKSKHAKWGFSHLLAILLVVVAGSAFAAGESLMHNSDNLGSTTYGAWGVAGGTYGQFTCSTCHSTPTNNVKRIVGSIPSSIGPNVNKTVVFNNMTGFGDDSASRTTSFRICEVCHTQTKYHRYDNTAQPGGLTHPNGDCVQCHPHADAFKATGCTSCHDHNVASGKPMATGQHTAHINNALLLGVNYSCADCHAPTVSSDTTFSNAANHNNGTKNYGGTLAGTFNAGTCTAYCHSNGKGGAPATAVNWTSGPALDCKGCHGGAGSIAGEPTYASGGGGSATANSHGKHVAAAADCVKCHADTTTNGTSIIGSHTNQTIDLKNGGGKTFTYTAGSKTCSNISCHGNGIFTPAAAQWGATLDCGGCHGKDSATMTSGSHQKHLADGATCSNCHSSTTTTNNSITGTTHIDGTVNLQQGGSFGAKSVQFAWAGSSTCNNISCHSPYGTPVNTAVWGTTANCNTCHPKDKLSGAHQVHMGALNLTSASVFYDMTANRTPAQDESVGRTYGFGCGTCHPMDKDANHLNGTVDVDLNRVNVPGVGTLRMLNHSTASYAMGSTKKCSNIYCHSNASRIEAESNVASNTSLAWTDTYAAHPELDRCAQCHGNQPTTGAHAAHSVGVHTFNDGVMLDGNIYNGSFGKLPIVNKPNTAHGNPNNSTTIGCYICHNSVVTSKRNDMNTKCKGCHFNGNSRGASYGVNASIANLSLHINGARNVQFAPVKMMSKAQVRPKGANTTSNSGFDFYSGVWQRTSYKSYSTLSYDIAKVAFDTATMWHPSTPMNSNCTNIACHNGKTVSWNLANFNDPNKCMDCHNQL